MIAALDLPAELTTPVGPVTLRRARPDDVDAVMALLADDPVSASRGDRARDADRPRYAAALAGIRADPSNDLLVAVTDDDAPVATMQLTSDAARTDAHRFYQRLGFAASHVGFKYRVG